MLAWIEKAFNTARQLDSPGVLFLMQANPRFEESPNAPEGFQEIIDALRDRSVEFAKPVVVAHGDSHYFRVDKPLEADTNGFGLQTLENFTRAENFGDPNVHWVRVTVVPKSANVFIVRASDRAGKQLPARLTGSRPGNDVLDLCSLL